MMYILDEKPLKRRRKCFRCALNFLFNPLKFSARLKRIWRAPSTDIRDLNETPRENNVVWNELSSTVKTAFLDFFPFRMIVLILFLQRHLRLICTINIETFYMYQ